MRRQSRPPTVKRRLLMHSPVILRFLSRSLSRVNASMRHTNLPAYPSPLPPPLFPLPRALTRLLLLPVPLLLLPRRSTTRLTVAVSLRRHYHAQVSGAA